MKELDQLNLTVVALVAIVAIVGLLALVLNVGHVASTGVARVSATQDVPADLTPTDNVAGEMKSPGSRCPPNCVE